MLQMGCAGFQWRAKKKSKGLIGGEPSSSSSCNRLEGKGELEDRLQMLLGREKWVLSVLAQVFSTR